MDKTLAQFSEAVSEALHDIRGATFEAIDRGLDKAMDYMVDRLVDATPVDSGLTRDSWEKTDKYKNVRYINNTRTTGERKTNNPDAVTARAGKGGIPVANLLEYGEKGKPFIRKTVKREQEKIISIIQEEIKNDT